MKVIQVLPCLGYGDAIGNDTMALYHALKEAGYDTEIYAEAVDARINIKAYTMEEWRTPSNDDVIIYHLSVGWKYIGAVKKAPCRKIAIYHNITPAEFFKEYDTNAYDDCSAGLKEVRELKDTFDYCLADSNFNKQDLISYGYICPIDVLPILIPFEDYRQTPSAKVIRHQKAKKGTKILFLGRIVPNKRIDELLRIFAYYQKYFDKDAVLNLVGRYNYGDIYYRRLRAYQKQLGIVNVNFTGHVRFNEILAYYRTADVFLCMSDHEGFCVPLLESMYFGIPIVAKDTTAIGDTLGNSGILLKNSNDLEVADIINMIMKDSLLRNKLVAGEQERLSDFDNHFVKAQFLNYLEAFLKR